MIWCINASLFSLLQSVYIFTTTVYRSYIPFLRCYCDRFFNFFMVQHMKILWLPGIFSEIRHYGVSDCLLGKNDCKWGATGMLKPAVFACLCSQIILFVQLSHLTLSSTALRKLVEDHHVKIAGKLLWHMFYFKFSTDKSYVYWNVDFYV